MFQCLARLHSNSEQNPLFRIYSNHQSNLRGLVYYAWTRGTKLVRVHPLHTWIDGMLVDGKKPSTIMKIMDYMQQDIESPGGDVNDVIQQLNNLYHINHNPDSYQCQYLQQRKVNEPSGIRKGWDNESISAKYLLYEGSGRYYKSTNKMNTALKYKLWSSKHTESQLMRNNIDIKLHRLSLKIERKRQESTQTSQRLLSTFKQITIRLIPRPFNL